MWEEILVFAIVAVAAAYVGRRLYLEGKGKGCEGCGCAKKPSESPDLVQIGNFDRDRG